MVRSFGAQKVRLNHCSKQALRLRRFLFASAFSLIYLVVLVLFRWQDKIDTTTLAQTFAIVGGLILAFCAMFLSNLNLRFRDPSPRKTNGRSNR